MPAPQLITVRKNPANPRDCIFDPPTFSVVVGQKVKFEFPEEKNARFHFTNESLFDDLNQLFSAKEEIVKRNAKVSPFKYHVVATWTTGDGPGMGGSTGEVRGT